MKGSPLCIHQKKHCHVIAETGYKKAHKTLPEKLILGFMGGMFISLGYLLDIRVIAGISEWGSFANFIGAALFPVGLICILLAGGELITSNMMAVAVAFFDKKIKLNKITKIIGFGLHWRT